MTEAPLRADDLLALPVRLHGIELGRPSDLLLDRDDLKAIGFDVGCGDGVHRFLALPVAIVTADEIAIRSPLVLFEPNELSFYTARLLALRSLRGRVVEDGGRELGTLADVVVAPDGSLTELVVATAGRERRVAFRTSVRVAPASRSAA